MGKLWRVPRAYGVCGGCCFLPAPPRWKLTGWRFPAGSVSSSLLLGFACKRSFRPNTSNASRQDLVRETVDAKQDRKSIAKEYLQLIAKGDQMGAALSTGIEIDPEAVGSARENMLLNGKAGGGEQTVVQDDHTMKTEAAADAWSTTGEDGEERCDLDEGEVLEFEDEAWKTFAQGGESSTVEPAAGFGEHDPAGAVVIDDVPAFSEEGEQSSVMDSVGSAKKLEESDAEEVSSGPAERRRIEP